jgi:hypothetical protein
VRFTPTDRALLAALLHRLPRQTLQRLRLLARPDTVLRWHRELLARRHAAASRPNARGGLALSGPSGSLFYGWPRRIPVGATGESTVSFLSWA